MICHYPGWIFQMLDKAIHQKNRYPVDKYQGNQLCYSADSIICLLNIKCKILVEANIPLGTTNQKCCPDHTGWLSHQGLNKELLFSWLVTIPIFIELTGQQGSYSKQFAVSGLEPQIQSLLSVCYFFSVVVVELHCLHIFLCYRRAYNSKKAKLIKKKVKAFSAPPFVLKAVMAGQVREQSLDILRIDIGYH